jgi:flagellar hook-associated protein 2
MQITGSYLNYQNITNLLSTMGVKSSGDLILGVFESSVTDLQNKIDKQVFSQESAKALSTFYGEVSDLAAKASRLTLDNLHSVFYDRSPVSSDPDVLTATAFDAFSADSGAAEAAYDLSVSQLARAQENRSMELNAEGATGVDQGENRFLVHINGQDFEQSITVEEGDTNEDVLQKMVSAINEENGMGVTAQIIEGPGEGTLQIAVQSDNTGVANEFTITDLSGSAVSATGADVVSQSALDALYTVDGESYSDGSNTIFLDDGMVTVNLKGEGESTLTVAPDRINVKEAVTSFISGMNSIKDFLDENKDYISDEVSAALDSSIDQHGIKLASFGITLNEEGRLDIDEMQLEESINQDFSDIKEAFAGFGGLAVGVENELNRISLASPLEYAKEAESMHTDFSDYIYSSSASMLTQILQGALLDRYV